MAWLHHRQLGNFTDFFTYNNTAPTTTVCFSTCTLSTPTGLRRLALTDWFTPTGSRRLVHVDWFTPIGLRRLARFDCLMFHDCFLCFRSPSPIHLDPSPSLFAPCLKPAPNPRRARGLLIGIRPRGAITQLTRQMKRAHGRSIRRATKSSALATEARSDSICRRPMKKP
jgi:hypothetical protein